MAAGDAFRDVADLLDLMESYTVLLEFCARTTADQRAALRYSAMVQDYQAQLDFWSGEPVDSEIYYSVVHNNWVDAYLCQLESERFEGADGQYYFRLTWYGREALGQRVKKIEKIATQCVSQNAHVSPVEALADFEPHAGDLFRELADTMDEIEAAIGRWEAECAASGAGPAHIDPDVLDFLALYSGQQVVIPDTIEGYPDLLRRALCKAMGSVFAQEPNTQSTMRWTGFQMVGKMLQTVTEAAREQGECLPATAPRSRATRRF